MYINKVSGLLISVLVLSTMLSTKKSDMASVPTEYFSISKEQFSLVELFTEPITEQRCLHAEREKIEKKDMPTAA